MKDISKMSWNKLWYLNVIFGLWIIIGLCIIFAQEFNLVIEHKAISLHYLIGIPGYALSGEMFAIVGFKGYKSLKEKHNA